MTYGSVSIIELCVEANVRVSNAPCRINSDFPDVNFNDWHVKEKEIDARILTVNADQWAILSYFNIIR